VDAILSHIVPLASASFPGSVPPAAPPEPAKSPTKPEKPGVQISVDALVTDVDVFAHCAQIGAIGLVLHSAKVR
jgi:hypothetical protein